MAPIWKWSVIWLIFFQLFGRACQKQGGHDRTYRVSGICCLLPVVRQVSTAHVCGTNPLFYSWNTHIWRFEPFRMLLLLLSSVHFSICGAEGGGITAFDGLYFVWGYVRKCKITHKVTIYWFYFTNILVKHGASRKKSIHYNSISLCFFFFFFFL